MYRFAGKIVGKALYENILTEQVFSRSFLNLVLGKENGLLELNELDPEIYKNLMDLKYTSVITTFKIN